MNLPLFPKSSNVPTYRECIRDIVTQLDKVVRQLAIARNGFSLGREETFTTRVRLPDFDLGVITKDDLESWKVWYQ